MKGISFLIALASLMLFPLGLAQAAQVELDGGVPATGYLSGDTVQMGVELTFNFRLNNDAPDRLAGFSLGFEVYTALSVANPATAGYFDPMASKPADADTIAIPGGWRWADPWNLTGRFDDLSIIFFSGDGKAKDTVGILAAWLGNSKCIFPAESLLFFYLKTVAHTDGDTICIDSCWYRPSNDWVWSMLADTGTYSIEPSWGGPYCYHVLDTTPKLVISPTVLNFSAIEGGPNPAPQSFLVASSGGPLNFNIIENISWAIPSPIQGTTPQNVNVLINILTLPTGTYVDSLQVVSGGAGNSPQYVKLVLVVQPPPPTICVDPHAFFFNAIAGDTNPSPKTLTITNCGSGTLNWTVSNSEAWLSLNPTSGVDSGDVTVSVDITGLPYGGYYDTIVVSDTNATNDPVLVPVTLNVASDLPVIDVDSAFNFIVWHVDSIFGPPCEILIKNVGGGLMNFWLVENSPRIFSLNPNSGTAPQTVQVTLKTSGAQPGVDYYDTLWVFSNEAINSPFPVVFQFHYVDNPAQLFVSATTVSLNVFECDMGADVPMPHVTVSVSNIGGDNPVKVKLVYETDLFFTNKDSGFAPFSFTITAKDLQLPLGTYLDTILIYAQNAINSPKTLIVSFNMIEGMTQPEIFLHKSSYTIPAQENAGPSISSAIGIFNKYGGCMPWEIQEDVPWLFPQPDSGNVPETVDLYADATGYVFGEYVDSLFILAPWATNSPKKVSLLFRVWRFHGDVNYDMRVNVVDLVYFVDYLSRSGPMPQPEFFVGDLNCDHLVNVVDVIYLVEYLFENGPIPCGNPYK
jgi:hypothetical protein